MVLGKQKLGQVLIFSFSNALLRRPVPALPGLSPQPRLRLRVGRGEMALSAAQAPAGLPLPLPGAEASGRRTRLVKSEPSLRSAKFKKSHHAHVHAASEHEGVKRLQDLAVTQCSHLHPYVVRFPSWASLLCSTRIFN